MKIVNVFGALGALMLMMSAGHASVVTRTYDIVATDFSPAAAPYDPVNIDFTVTFDDSMTFGPTTSGLTVHSNTTPYSLQYAYDMSQDTLTLASYPGSDGHSYTVYTDSIGTFIGDATSLTPFDIYLSYRTTDGTIYTAGVHTLTATPLMSGVPLPASAPMFGAALLALGAIGYGVKRKSAAA